MVQMRRDTQDARLGIVCKKGMSRSLLRGNGTSSLEQRNKLAVGAELLDVGVAADVLLADVDVGDGALAADLLEGVLKLVAVGWRREEMSVNDS